VSPDNKNVYVAAAYSNSIVTFKRHPATDQSEISSSHTCSIKKINVELTDAGMLGKQQQALQVYDFSSRTMINDETVTNIDGSGTGGTGGAVIPIIEKLTPSRGKMSG
jgi:hypothetical protein